MDKGEKGYRRMRIFLILMLVCCLGGSVLLFTFGHLELKDRRAGVQFYEQEAQPQLAEAETAVQPEAEATAEPAEPAEPEETAELIETDDVLLQPVKRKTPSEMDFASMRKDWPDVKGWVRIDDTRIDYPVVQGKDNIYYLNHLPNKKRNTAGAIMLDVSNHGDFTDMVSILHGHHMKSGNMFGDLDLFLEEAYCRAHPTVKLYTPDGDCTADIFAVCHVDAKVFKYPIAFSEAAEFDAFVQKCIDDTPYDLGIVPQFGDQLLMLSTCAYVQYDDARLLVIARINAQ